MIYKNKNLLWACSKEPKIRKKSPMKKHTSPAIASITKQISTRNYSEHVTIDSSRQESTVEIPVLSNSPSSKCSQIVLLLCLLFLTIFIRIYYFPSPWTCTDRPSHRYTDISNQNSCKYNFFHRTRHKPPGLRQCSQLISDNAAN